MNNSVKIKPCIHREMMKNTVKYNTRVSQSIVTYGVGSMVDFPDMSLMTAAPEYWTQSTIEIHDTRLEDALGVNAVRMPGTIKEIASTQMGISYVRFPEWYFCPVCRRIQSLKSWTEEYKRFIRNGEAEDPYMLKHMKCYKCACDLAPSGFVVVCKNGHISDFPWVEWAHAKDYRQLPICGNPRLKFKTGSSMTEGLQGLVVECDNCNASATFKDAFKPTVFRSLIESGHQEFVCKGRHPWRGTKCACSEFPVTKQRGDTSVYYSNIVSSIVIPSNEDELLNKINECAEMQKIRTVLGDCDDDDERTEKINKKLQKWSENIARELLLETDTVCPSLKKLLREDNQTEKKMNLDLIDSMEFREDEYKALCGITPSVKGSKDFLCEEMNIGDYDIPGVQKVVLVKRLREVCALIGFSRLEAVNPSSDNFVSIKGKDTNWYPGYEVRGEGIFLKLDDKVLNNWANTEFAIKRGILFRDNFARSKYGLRGGIPVSPQYVLLHTISHLLIKQLSFECGYNVASLRERLYYSPFSNEHDEGMAGILIYTAGGDSEGTLGGLVRQGRSDCLTRIFKNAIDNAKMCSSDPVCITSLGQGRNSQNLAACHSCCLIPETSCEQFNIALDRGMVIGTFEEPSAGLYSIWKEIPSEIPVNRSDSETTVLLSVCEAGMPMTDLSNDTIWDYIIDDSNDEAEKQVLEELKLRAVRNYEKPIYKGELKRADGTRIQADYIWKQSKTALFLSENIDEYGKAVNNGWKCYCEAVIPINVDQLLKDIEK